MVYFALIASIVIFVVLTYKRMSPLLVAPIVTVVLALLGGIDPTDTLLQGYMGLAGNYVKSFFFVFMTGALFAQIMGKTGAAESIARGIVKVIGKKWVVLAVVFSTAVLTYGGISLFIIFFVMYPMALSMHKEGNITKLLIPGEIALGAFTFTMTTPGSPQVQNIVPTTYLGTSPTSAFLPGWIAGILMCLLGLLYLMARARSFAKKGIGFDAIDELEKESTEHALPGFVVSILPSVAVIVLLNVIKLNIVWAMTAGIVLSIVLMWKYIPAKDWLQVVNTGAANSTGILLNTAAIVGYAGGVMLLPQFPQIVEAVKNISMNPYFFPAVSTSILSAVCASSSGGLSVTYGALTETFRGLGIPLEVVHRVSSMASGTIDSLPHCPAVINLINVTKTTHRQVYGDIAVLTILIPTLIVYLVLVPLCMLMY